MGEFTGKIAIVAGAASGIGEAIAAKFYELGASVVVADADSEGTCGGPAPRFRD